ncbi:hypothetical protein HHL22_01435 [Hymenobacter sp. RP-2-7]|uniref:Uncharacterized protein n=1 Tax=Hymenobacter polaris TaxID=2682546 RepID=A0A7Y0AAZ2_9BACT|nr:hypothetical protein [Hymenobacter polaris]NML63857.1 hypothetical protein [Hymenobacter polaris]
MKKPHSLAAALFSAAGALLLAACNGPAPAQVADASTQTAPTKAPIPDSAAPAAAPSRATGAAVPFVGQPGVGAALRAAAAKNH